MKEIVFEPGGRNQQIFDTMWRFNQGFWFEDKRPANVTNLCQWIRVVIIWPFIHVAAFCAAAFALYSALAYCISELSDPVASSNFWWYVTRTIGIIATVVGVFVAWALLKEWKRSRDYQKKATASYH